MIFLTGLTTLAGYLDLINEESKDPKIQNNWHREEDN
jgi:hypothetical protein